MSTFNRLQLRHHGIGSGYTVAEGVFDSREDAIEYIFRGVKFAEDGLAAYDPTQGLSLFAEPTILRYKNEENEADPHVILAIGSVTNTENRHSKNKFCIIDIDYTESEIKELGEKLEEAIKMFSIIPIDSDTLDLTVEKTEEGTYISGDVKVSDGQVFNKIHRDNDILVTEEGLFVFVGLEYNDETGMFSFTVNGDTNTFRVNGNQVVSGEYNPEDESLHIHNKFGDEVVIDLEYLIDEWVVEGDATKSPIVLTRKEVGFGGESEHYHVEPWQDILSADVRIADERVNNILKKTSDNRYLYVDGVASNIVYYSNGQKTNVENALNELSKMRVSTDSNNIITTKTDGFFASTKLEYLSKENTLVFTTSSNDEDEKKKETRIKLNSFSVFENIVYDSSKETLIITYLDSNGDTQFLTIPIGEMITDWELTVQNYGHSVFLKKERSIQGSDQLSADVNIAENADNILTELNHQLYVKGTADNIKFGRNSNVADEIIALKQMDDEIVANVEALSGKSEQMQGQIQTIGENVDALSEKVDTIETNLNSEIERASSEEARIETKFDEALGEGFDVRNSVRDALDAEKAEREASDAALNATLNELSANTESRLKSIVNNDHSIDVDNTDAVNPVIKVNLSSEIEDGKENIIKLNSDGLYAGVDLRYEFNEEVGTNQLIFSTTNGTKTIDLQTNSVIDKIYYDPNREAIIIEYTINGHRMPDVVIPVGDLINEWRIWDGHEGAVQLEKERIASGTSEQDVLKATVVISDAHEDNILVNDGGALYVAGKGITDNRRDIDELIERMGVAENDIDGLERGLQAEAARLDDAYAELSRQISTESSRAQQVEDSLNTTIANEIARSTAKDDELSSKIANEITRSTEKDTELENAINYESVRATSAETALNNAIETEKTSRINEDSRIETKLDNEIARATSAEETIATNLANEVSRSTSKDEELNGKIDSEISRATEKESAIETALTAETTRATSAETALNSALETETLNRTNEDARIETKLDNEIARSTAKDEELANALADAVQDINDRIDAEKLGVEDSASVDLEINDNNKIVANAIISTKDSNIVKVVSDTAEGTGIYATVDLTYDSATNKLTLKTTGAEKEIPLSTGSIIKSIEYDPVGKNLVIKYERTSGGETHELTVTVPVEDLFNDFIVQEGEHLGAIILKKEEGTAGNPDILSAEIVISTLEDNILINDQGSLYVSGRGIAENKAAIEALDARITDDENEIETLQNGLASEIARATDKENEIARNLSDEIARATNAETVLTNNLISEIERVDAIDQKLDNEIARSTEKDSAIETALTAETVRATSAETALNTAISNLNNSLASEVSRSTEKDNELESKINNEIERSSEKDNALEASLASETVRATSAETALNTAIDNLNTAIGNETARATEKENALDSKIDEKVAELNDKIDDRSLSVKDTVTVDMEIDEDNKISSNVVISAKNSNIIKAVSDSADGTGIYASVDLEYNASTNKLKLITSTGEKEIALSVGSILKSVEYDDATKSLIIKYDTMSGGQAIEQTLIVPVADLFNDWIVQEGQHLGAIILNKEEGTGGNPDILSAEVVISTLSDNMLINDQGALYVSSRPIDELSAQVETFKEEYEESLKTTETPTLKLYRDASKHLMGDVKISTDEKNLIKVDNANEGIIFDGNIDLGVY